MPAQRRPRGVPSDIVLPWPGQEPPPTDAPGEGDHEEEASSTSETGGTRLRIRASRENRASDSSATLEREVADLRREVAQLRRQLSALSAIVERRRD